MPTTSRTTIRIDEAHLVPPCETLATGCGAAQCAAAQLPGSHCARGASGSTGRQIFRSHAAGANGAAGADGAGAMDSGAAMAETGMAIGWLAHGE